MGFSHRLVADGDGPGDAPGDAVVSTVIVLMLSSATRQLDGQCGI
jgi:hypothetical protein